MNEDYDTINNNGNIKEQLLLQSLKKFYMENDSKYFYIILSILCYKTIKDNNNNNNVSKKKQQQQSINNNNNTLTKRISLRLLNWLVTNYSKKHNIRYTLENNQSFNIFLEYKNQLKSFSKKFFDPFRRRNRVFYTNTHDIIFLQSKLDHDLYKKRKDGIITTLAQLNAFRWFLKYKVLDYALQHLTEIEKDMITTEKLEIQKIQEKKQEKEKKRRELSKNSHKGYTMYSVYVKVSF